MNPQLDAEADRVLVERCLADDGDAWESLVHQYRPLLARRVASRLGRKTGDPEVEDHVQEVFLSLLLCAHARLHAFNAGRDSLLAFLTRLAMWRVPHSLTRARRFRAYGLLLGEDAPMDSRWGPGLDQTLYQWVETL